MKTKLVLTMILASFLLLTGCSNNDGNVKQSEALSKSSSASKSSSVTNQTYPEAQAEVLATFVDIATNITLGAGLGYGFGSDDPNEYMDQLISFHDYEGYTFTEFNYDSNGVGHSYTAEENEVNERTLFGTIVDEGGVQKFAAVPGTLNIAVYYGNVANLTFISDFELRIGGDLHIVNNLITLLFVKTKGEWKMVHEHHSPLKVDPSTGSETGSIPSEAPDLSSPAQQEVYATFGAIGASIMANSGTGSENMDELISFHAYGPKFTEFNYDPNGNGYSFNSEENEANERAFFGGNKVTRFAAKANTVNIAVYYG
ncbi:MAG: nuclear transport factor 2 family protein, partial [Flavobacteriaceae bacterium]|nr:nuclear transport factor 2 family protein [Flavobacteriaceae bacterium]